MQYVKMYEYSPELIDTILASVDGAVENALISQIAGTFSQAGLIIRIKHCFPDTPNEYYRITCHIKKSAEAVIVNTRQDLGKDGVTDGMSVQLRITDQRTFDTLERLSEGVRRQIVGAIDCRFCSDKCTGKKYVFSYEGNEYTKCRYICSNFRLTAENTSDIESIMDIVRSEIEYNRKK